MVIETFSSGNVQGVFQHTWLGSGRDQAGGPTVDVLGLALRLGCLQCLSLW